MPVQVQASASMTGCNNSPGPQITLSGTVSLGGLTFDMIFRNNAIGTHTLIEESSVDVQAVPAGGTLQIPKQPVLGGVGGNPFIWAQMLDGSGNALTSEIFLGRCVQGPFKLNAAVGAQVGVLAEFTALDCSNNPGPYITMEGAMSFSKGLMAKFIFRNSDNPVDGPHEADRSVNVTLVPSGTTVQFPKQPVLGGVGGNPWISVLFKQGDGSPIGTEVLLGRCVQLEPGN
jgi:hypothetical protein